MPVPAPDPLLAGVTAAAAAATLLFALADRRRTIGPLAHIPFDYLMIASGIVFLAALARLLGALLAGPGSG